MGVEIQEIQPGDGINFFTFYFYIYLLWYGGTAPPSFRPNNSLFLRNRCRWFRIWPWFAWKSSSFGDRRISLNKSDNHHWKLLIYYSKENSKLSKPLKPSIPSNPSILSKPSKKFWPRSTLPRRPGRHMHFPKGGKMQISSKLEHYHANQDQIWNQRPRLRRNRLF